MATNNVSIFFRMVSNNSLNNYGFKHLPWGVNRGRWGRGVICSRWSKRGELFEGGELFVVKVILENESVTVVPM